MPNPPAFWSPAVGPIYLTEAQARRVLNLSDLVPSSIVQTFLTHLARQLGDQEINEAAPITLAGAAVQSTVVRWPVVNGENAARLAFITGVAMGVQILSDFDHIRWAVRLDGSPLPGLDNIRGPFGVFVYPRPTLIAVGPDQVVDIVASNLTAVAIPNVTAALTGYQFPSQLDQGQYPAVRPFA